MKNIADKPAEMTWTDYWRGQVALLQQIKDEFTSPAGNIQWRMAFRARPEWERALLPRGASFGHFKTWFRKFGVALLQRTSPRNQADGPSPAKRAYTRTDRQEAPPQRKRNVASRAYHQAAATSSSMPELMTCPCCNAQFAILNRGRQGDSKVLATAIAVAKKLGNSFA